jgi:hypothetical protein
MDIASKIKMLKEEAQRLDDERIKLDNQNKELAALVETNKARAQKVEELKVKQSELLKNIE